MTSEMQMQCDQDFNTHDKCSKTVKANMPWAADQGRAVPQRPVPADMLSDAGEAFRDSSGKHSAHSRTRLNGTGVANIPRSSAVSSTLVPKTVPELRSEKPA